MKQEPIVPTWHFSTHDDPLTNIETLHLILWTHGLCIAGYDDAGKILVTKMYLFDHAWENDKIESIFINEPLVAGPQPVTRIWIADERSMLVPEHLFDQEASALWLRKLFFIEEGESIRFAPALKDEAQIVYPVNNRLVAIAGKFFKEANIHSLSEVLLGNSDLQDQDTIKIFILGHTVLFTIREKGKLLAHQVFNSGDINDLVYRIAAICNEYSLPQQQLNVSIAGAMHRPEHMAAELKAYFPGIVIPDSEQSSSFTLLSELKSCE
jgi:hypothetical protein